MNIILTALTLASVEPSDKAKTSISVEIQAPVATTESVETIRKNYQEGKYKENLKELDDSFNEAKKDDGLRSLAETRISSLPNFEELSALMKSIIQERNQELQTLVEGDSSPSAEVVKKAIQPIPQEIEKAIITLSQFQILAPGSGKNNDENKLIDIDFEYQYKMLHLDMPLLMGQKVENLREKRIALKIEKLDKMFTASENFNDKELKSAVETVYTHFDGMLNDSATISDLNQMGRNPKTPLEEKVSSILVKYQDRLAEITTTFFQNQNNA